MADAPATLERRQWEGDLGAWTFVVKSEDNEHPILVVAYMTLQRLDDAVGPRLGDELVLLRIQRLSAEPRRPQRLGHRRRPEAYGFKPSGSLVGDGNRCVDVPAPPVSAGGDLQLFGCNGGGNQAHRWDRTNKVLFTDWWNWLDHFMFGITNVPSAATWITSRSRRRVPIRNRNSTA